MIMKKPPRLWASQNATTSSIRDASLNGLSEIDLVPTVGKIFRGDPLDGEPARPAGGTAPAQARLLHLVHRPQALLGDHLVVLGVLIFLEVPLIPLAENMTTRICFSLCVNDLASKQLVSNYVMFAMT